MVCRCQFIALFDAGPAAITVGSSVSVSFVNLSFSGCDAVQVWERVNPVRCVVMLLRNMAGAAVVKVLRFFCAECPCCLPLSGFFFQL